MRYDSVRIYWGSDSRDRRLFCILGLAAHGQVRLVGRSWHDRIGAFRLLLDPRRSGARRAHIRSIWRCLHYFSHSVAMVDRGGKTRSLGFDRRGYLSRRCCDHPVRTSSSLSLGVASLPSLEQNWLLTNGTSQRLSIPAEKAQVCRGLRGLRENFECFADNVFSKSRANPKVEMA